MIPSAERSLRNRIVAIFALDALELFPKKRSKKERKNHFSQRNRSINLNVMRRATAIFSMSSTLFITYLKRNKNIASREERKKSQKYIY